MNIETDDWTSPVLHFWFKELTNKDWFMGSSELDKTISDRFRQTHEFLAKLSAPDIPKSAHSVLAAVLVLDQFSRNMFRGSSQAFAFDDLALGVAKLGISHQLDSQLGEDEKLFMYLPFMHSENLSDQAQAVTLFTQLNKSEHALEHQAIIQQFGRFPHRNEVLGRTSTPAEVEYLKDAKRFGQ